MKEDLCCCVCLKDEPFENNPIVSCEGGNCKTIVHKVCYGIQDIPDGAWFCQKCLYQESSACVRCELCPSVEGALKQTTKGGWCHIICALFVPGAKFIGIDKLETVCLDNVSRDKSNKVCSICEKNDHLDQASIGACVKCLKNGCDVMFHATCGQSQGLLTEIVSTKECIRYVAYCFLHYHKTKRRDFTVCHSSKKYYTNKVQQSPPLLEKSCEYDITQHDSSVNLPENDFLIPNISPLCGYNVLSSNSATLDDFRAPEICSTSEYSTSEKYNITDTNNQLLKFTDVSLLQSSISSPVDSMSFKYLLSSNIRCCDTNETVMKKEATVKNNMFSSGSPVNISPEYGEMFIFPTAKRQGRILNSLIPQKKVKLVKAEEKCELNIQMNETPIKLEKMLKNKELSEAIKTKIENRYPAKGSLPSSSNCSIIHSPNITNQSVSTLLATPKMCSTNFQSLEDLLEWQWDQTSSLLLQQADTTDISSLLSCLHDLKNENEELLIKQLKLCHRRDHLKAVNAKLQLQLLQEPIKYDTNTFSDNTNDLQSTESLSRILKKVPPIEKKHAQCNQMSLISSPFHNDMRPLSFTEDNSLFFQQSIQSSYQNSHVVGSHLNHQSHIPLDHYGQQKKIVSSGVSESDLFSQSELVTLLKNQIHSQFFFNQNASIWSCNPIASTTQDLQICTKNEPNAELYYQSFQTNKDRFQPQSALTSNVFYQTSDVTTQQSLGIKYEPNIS